MWHKRVASFPSRATSTSISTVLCPVYLLTTLVALSPEWPTLARPLALDKLGEHVAELSHIPVRSCLDQVFWDLLTLQF